jgi:hypothetical protein
MPLNHHVLKTLRTIHLYLGVFIAPMLLFFAVTGGLQSFSLHESTRGSNYTPPTWLASAAQFHKKQTTVMPQRKRPPSEAAAATAPAQAAPPTERTPAPKPNLVPMKAFFALVALGLATSVSSGLYMAWRYSRKPALFGIFLGAGVLLPLLLWLL